MDIFDRLQYIVDKEDCKNLADFSIRAKVKYETLRGTLKYKRSKPGYEVLKNIIINIEWVNPDWLMTGRGEPEIKINDPAEIIDQVSTIELSKKEDRLLTIIESQQRTIENLSKSQSQSIAGTA